MDTGHGYMSRISAIREVNLDARVTLLRNIVITAPGICKNRCTGLNIVAYERDEATTRGIWHTPHSHVPKSLGLMDFNGNEHNFLSFGTTASFATFFAASHECFIHLNMPTKTIMPQSHHRASQLVQPSPCRLIAA